MKIKPLLECIIDISDPVAELSAVITAVLANHPDKQADILRALDEQIGLALIAIDDEAKTEDTADDGNGRV